MPQVASDHNGLCETNRRDQSVQGLQRQRHDYKATVVVQLSAQVGLPHGLAFLVLEPCS